MRWVCACEIAAPLRRPQIAGRRGATQAIACRQLKIAGAVLLLAIEIVRAWHAHGFGCIDETFADLAFNAHIADAERPASAMMVVGAPFLILGAHEVGEHIAKAPSSAAKLSPVIEVGGVPTDVQQAIDGARASEHLSARPVQAASAEARAWLGLVHPVSAGIVHGLEVADRDVDPDVSVVAACFEQEHARAAVGREPIGEDAARRAGPHDDVVPIPVHLSACLSDCSRCIPGPSPRAIEPSSRHRR
jgi:hypothetical protein